MKRLLKDKRGEGFVDVCVLVLAIAMVLALVVRIAPVFVAKQLSMLNSSASMANCSAIRSCIVFKMSSIVIR